MPPKTGHLIAGYLWSPLCLSKLGRLLLRADYFKHWGIVCPLENLENYWDHFQPKSWKITHETSRDHLQFSTIMISTVCLFPVEFQAETQNWINNPKCLHPSMDPYKLRSSYYILRFFSGVRGPWVVLEISEESRHFGTLKFCSLFFFRNRRKSWRKYNGLSLWWCRHYLGTGVRWVCVLGCWNYTRSVEANISPKWM